jgi:hypothetical protein
MHTQRLHEKHSCPLRTVDLQATTGCCPPGHATVQPAIQLKTRKLRFLQLKQSVYLRATTATLAHVSFVR